MYLIYILNLLNLPIHMIKKINIDDLDNIENLISTDINELEIILPHTIEYNIGKHNIGKHNIGKHIIINLENYKNLSKVKIKSQCNYYKETLSIKSNFITDLDYSSTRTHTHTINELPLNLKILKFTNNHIEILPDLPKSLLRLEFSSNKIF